jgi:hypothetical protein
MRKYELNNIETVPTIISIVVINEWGHSKVRGRVHIGRLRPPFGERIDQTGTAMSL